MSSFRPSAGPQTFQTASPSSNHSRQLAHLFAQVERATESFGCNIHHLLRTDTPPKVQDADVAFTPPSDERCSSRTIEEGIAKTRAALGQALADVLLEFLWLSSRDDFGELSETSHPGAPAEGVVVNLPPPRVVATATFMQKVPEVPACSATTGGAVPLASDLPPIQFTATRTPNHTTEAEAPEARWVLNGRYELLAPLGRSVWRAGHLAMGQSLAIKILPRSKIGRCELSQESQHRVATTLIGHPNTVPLHEVIDDPNCNSVFLVMPLAKPLPCSLDAASAQLIAEEGPSVDTILTCAKGAASALAVFHAAGIVHCDIKLDNLLLLPRTASSDTKTNFAIASLAAWREFNGSNLNLLRGRGGTLAYWAPECFAAKRQSDTFTAASDCYALGLCLYAMAFGKFPYWTPDITNPLSWEKVIPGTARYEGSDAELKVPRLQNNNKNTTILCAIVRGLLANEAPQRMLAKQVLELVQ